MNCYTREQIEATMASKGYKYFTGGDYDVNIIGFHVIKRVKRWDIEKHINNYKDYNDKIQQYNKMRKDLTKDKALAVDEEGYNKFFILDGKKLKVENFDMGNAEVKKGTASELKRIFGKSMANRLVSRVVLTNLSRKLPNICQLI